MKQNNPLLILGFVAIAAILLMPSSLAEAVKIDGTPGNDVLTGSSGNDRMNGGGGNDIMNGGLGNDNMKGSGGNDSMNGEGGDDQVHGGNGEDWLMGEDGKDLLEGGLGEDKLFGGNGDDMLDGGSDSDDLDGGSGNDDLKGGSGDDDVVGGAGNDRLTGQAGNDHLNGGAGDDELTAGSGDDFLFGDEGDDLLVGGVGFNFINGGTGDETSGDKCWWDGGVGVGGLWDSNGDSILDEPRDDVIVNCETEIRLDVAGTEAPPGEQPPSGGKGKGGGEDPPPANISIDNLIAIIDNFGSGDIKKGDAKNLKATLDLAKINFGNGGDGDPDGCNNLVVFEGQVNAIPPNKIDATTKGAILTDLPASLNTAGTGTKAQNGC